MQAAFPVHDRRALAPMFAGMNRLHGIAAAGLADTGRVWADSPYTPRGAVMAVGDFLLCGGEAGPWAAHLLRCAVQSDKRAWLIDAPGAWANAVPQAVRARTVSRWAFDPAVQPEDKRLRKILTAMPENVHAVPLAGRLISCCREHEWSRDFVSTFADDADYAARGLGMLLMQDNVPVAGASSYVAYPGGMEVQVQTRDGFEGCGYATLAAAALILAAHERGLAVTWDAANLASARIAEKLGYSLMGTYSVFEADT